MKVTVPFLLSIAVPAAVLALCALVVAVQLIEAALPGALDQWGRICLGAFFGTLFGTWIVKARLGSTGPPGPPGRPGPQGPSGPTGPAGSSGS